MDSVRPPEATKTAFDLVLLGPPTLRDGNGQIPAGLGSGKPLALLSFLVLRTEVRRDEALALLWGDVGEDRARNAFRQALHRLRLALGEDLVVGDRQYLRMASADRLRTDVLEFQKAVEDDRLDDAITLYRGDFMEGFEVGSSAFDQWAESERARLRSRCQSAAERTAQRALVEGRLGDAETAIRKLLMVAPLDRRAVEIAATTLMSMGRREDAAEVLQQFRRRSSDVLGAPLPPELQVMLDRMPPPKSRQPAGQSGKETAFVGRSAELAKLLAVWHAVDEDSGATLVIEGPVGIGKSRLVRELAEGVRSLGASHTLHGVEGPRGSAVPYSTIAIALRPLVRAPGVAGASPHLLAEAARLLPELRDTFQLPPVEPIHEDTARLRVCEGVAALLEAAAYERPICLVLEDLERAPATTLELLGYLALRLRRAPVLLVLAFNPESASAEVASRLRALAGGTSRDARVASAETFRLSLAPLAVAQTGNLVTQILGSAATPDAVNRLAERAEGNPLRAIELARSALEGGEPTSLPVHLADIVRDRIQSCSANERRLLLVASLLSEAATLRVLAEASHVPAVAAGEAAQSLERRGLLHQEGIGYAPSSQVVSVASMQLAGDATTAFVSGWVAEVLAREPDVSRAELVRLFGIAGRAAETHRYAREAGERAGARGAVEEAIHFLTVARAFARTNHEHAAVEGQLAAHGAGRPRLAGPEKSSRDRESGVAATLLRHFPNWRYLIAAAIVTSVVAIGVTAWGPTRGVSAFATTDTLVVTKSGESRRGLVQLVTGDPTRRLRISEAMGRFASKPAWVDSLMLPWINAIPSPTGRFVGVERVTTGGSNVYLIDATRRDTIPLVVGDVEAFGLGWSPDGESFLVTRRMNDRGGDYRVGLYAFSTSRTHPPIAIDTSTNHSVSEASWSPDGSRIGWVSRVGSAQEEVFVSWADGSHRRNLSAHPAQDAHLAWSPDGSLIAFTSRRDGNAELYAYDLLNDRLWRLTQDEAQDDRAAFSGDGRYVAFESTRGGATDVYVMPSLGGTGTRVGDSTSSYEIVGWRRWDLRYLGRLELRLPASTRRGDTVVMRVDGLDQMGAQLDPLQARWTVIDQTLLRELAPQTEIAASLEQRFLALHDGLARVEVSVGAWRTDTAYVAIGDGPIALLHDTFSGAALSSSWRALGRPSPAIGLTSGNESGLLINADRQWESGVLSSASVPVQSGLTVEATLHAPFEVHATATTASLALVAPEPVDAIDPDAPRFLRTISVTWNADGRRLVYAAERDVFVEAVPAGKRAAVRTLGIVVNADGTVSFFVDGVARWRSTLRVLRADRASRAQIWLGGQDTGSRVAFTNVNASLRSAAADRR